MPSRRGWKGHPPANSAEARRMLLEAASLCVERRGMAAATLADVAQQAGVTRQTVYRYFEDTQDLFRSAAALSSGGFLERLRQRVRQEQGLADRVVECMVFAILHLPADPHLAALTTTADGVSLRSLLELGFVQEEFGVVAEGEPGLTPQQLDELSELLLRLMQSFLREPGPERDEAQLRQVLGRWLLPVIKAQLT